MSKLLPSLLGLAMLALLVIVGLFSATELAHPFWQTRAALTGGLAGAVLAFTLTWLSETRPGLARTLGAALGLALSVAIFVTWRAARTFIDSADYEPMAGQVWFLGFHVMAALIVALVAMLAVVILRR